MFRAITKWYIISLYFYNFSSFGKGTTDYNPNRKYNSSIPITYAFATDKPIASFAF